MSNEQAVVGKTEGQSMTGAEGSDAQDETFDLDALLSEFDEPDGESPNDKAPARDAKISPDDIRFAVDQARSRAEREAQEATNRAIADAVSTVKPELADLPVDLSDRVVRGALEAYAHENPKFAQAFMHRSRNPEAWTKALRAVAKELKADFSPVDRDATSDRESLASAVRAASTPAQRQDDAPDFNNMSDAQFAAWKRKHDG